MKTFALAVTFLLLAFSTFGWVVVQIEEGVLPHVNVVDMGIWAGWLFLAMIGTGAFAGILFPLSLLKFFYWLFDEDDVEDSEDDENPKEDNK